jgi:MFS family permease
MEPNGTRVFYGYVIVTSAFFIQAIAWGINNSFGVFFNPLLTEFGWLRATISFAVSINFLIHGLVSIFVGGLNDRFGPRLIMTGCGVFLGLGYLLMTGINAVWQLYLFYGLIVGVGLGGMDVILLSTVARWFLKKRGTMSGIIKAGTGVGMAIMPVLVTWLIKSYGWRTSFEKESEVGKANNTEGGLSFREAVHTRQFWTICAVYFVILFCVYTILMHIVQHAIDLGISAADAAKILAAIGAVSIAGRFIMGGAGDRIGNRAALLICLLLLLLGLIWLQWARTLWMFYLFAVIHGFAHGGFFALTSPIVAGLFGTRFHGLIFGIVIFSSTIGGAIGPVLAGHMFDLTQSYQKIFMVLTALSIIGLILTVSLRPIRRDGVLTHLDKET